MYKLSSFSQVLSSVSVMVGIGLFLCLVGFLVVQFSSFSGFFSLLGVAFRGIDGLCAVLVVFLSFPIQL